MKNIYYTLTLLCFLFLFCGSACKKHLTNPYSDNGLPPATQTGANIFACRVNGEVWIAKKSVYDIKGSVNGDTLIASGANSINSNNYEAFYIYIKKYVSIDKKYELNDSLKSSINYLSDRPCFAETGGYGVGRAESSDGELTLTRVDTVKKIISGTFWATIPTAYCDTLHITDGRFDIDYR